MIDPFQLSRTSDRRAAGAGRDLRPAGSSAGRHGLPGSPKTWPRARPGRLDLASSRPCESGRAPRLIGPKWLHVAATDITALGSVTVLSLVILLAFALLVSLRRWSRGLLLLVGAGGGLMISQGLKRVRARAAGPGLPRRRGGQRQLPVRPRHAVGRGVPDPGRPGRAVREKRRVKVLALGGACWSACWWASVGSIWASTGPATCWPAGAWARPGPWPAGSWPSSSRDALSDLRLRAERA
jgi:undecaprenyl-diphosphatase